MGLPSGYGARLALLLHDLGSSFNDLGGHFPFTGLIGIRYLTSIHYYCAVGRTRDQADLLSGSFPRGLLGGSNELTSL